MRPTITSTTLSRNGTRHPHARKASGLTFALMRVKVIVDSRSPAPVPSGWPIVYWARLASGACSPMKRAALAHSPPAAMPWMKRRTKMRIGAATPQAAAGWITPMRALATPMISSVVIMVALRPTLSPNQPKITPPSGRAMNATPMVAKDATAAAVSPSAGKNTVGNTSAAAVPKMKKS